MKSFHNSNYSLINLPVKQPVLFLIILLGGFSCRENIEMPPDTPPGKRDYVWSMDSIDYGGHPSTIQLESIWGSSATDLWGAAGDAPDVRDCLWHFDGLKWSRATEGTPITEFTGNKVVYDVWGSAQNDVWAVGRKINGGKLSAFLMHFDGNRWVDATPSNISNLSSNLYCISGVDKNDIWVGGDDYGLHYDGLDWKSYKIADSLTVGSMTRHEGHLYAYLGSPWGKDTTYIFMFADSVFREVDRTTLGVRKFGGGLFVSNSKLKTLTDGVISTSFRGDGTIDTSNWQKELNIETSFRAGFVQSDKNVFAVGVWNLIYQYNGTDWKRIFISIPNYSVSPDSYFWGIWTNGSEVFICDWDHGIIYHGR
jgi:hypothetical protein